MIRYICTVYIETLQKICGNYVSINMKFLMFFVLTMPCHGFFQGRLNVSQRVRRSGHAPVDSCWPGLLPCHRQAASRNNQGAPLTEKKNKTQVFLVYFGQRGVCNKKWDEVWRRACIYVGRTQNVVWFVDWRCWRNVRDSFENDLIYNIWSFKMPRLLEFLSPWQALVEAKTSKKVYTHMCERTTPWKHGVPQRFSGTPGVVEDEG